MCGSFFQLLGFDYLREDSSLSISGSPAAEDFPSWNLGNQFDGPERPDPIPDMCRRGLVRIRVVASKTITRQCTASRQPWVTNNTAPWLFCAGGPSRRAGRVADPCRSPNTRRRRLLPTPSGSHLGPRSGREGSSGRRRRVEVAPWHGSGNNSAATAEAGSSTPSECRAALINAAGSADRFSELRA